VCWLYVLSRKLIVDSGIAFQKHILSEDTLFMLRLFIIPNLEILETDMNIYRYRIRQGSAVTTISANYVKTKLNALLDLVKEEDYLIESSCFPNFPPKIRMMGQKEYFSYILKSTLSYKEIKK